MSSERSCDKKKECFFNTVIVVFFEYDTFGIGLAKRFEMKDLGILHHFLGVKVDCNLVTGSDNQSTQLEWNILSQSAPQSAQMPSSSRRQKTVMTLTRECIKQLNYCICQPRPDQTLHSQWGKWLVFVLAQLGNTGEHWAAVKRILRYLRGHQILIYSTARVIHLVVWDSLMRIGAEIGSPLQDTSS